MSVSGSITRPFFSSSVYRAITTTSYHIYHYYNTPVVVDSFISFDSRIILPSLLFNIDYTADLFYSALLITVTTISITAIVAIIFFVLIYNCDLYFPVE
jgi:hypothetical protein